MTAKEFMVIATALGHRVIKPEWMTEKDVAEGCWGLELHTPTGEVWPYSVSASGQVTAECYPHKGQNSWNNPLETYLTRPTNLEELNEAIRPLLRYTSYDPLVREKGQALRTLAGLFSTDLGPLSYVLSMAASILDPQEPKEERGL